MVRDLDPPAGYNRSIYLFLQGLASFHNKGIPAMRIAIITLATSFAVAASPDMPSGTSWGADARSAALAHAFWTDSSNWNLYDLAGHSAVLPGLGTKSLELRAGTQGLGAEGSGAKASQNQAGLLQIRGAVENKAGYRLDFGTISQTYVPGEGAPEYEASRMRWGFDLGTAFGPDRLVGLGLGARFRLPSRQTQDTSGEGNAPGSFERWQPGLEALRLGMAFHFAKAVTLAGKFEASADIDTLEHAIQPTGNRSLHRFGVVRLPVLSFSAQFQRPDLPVQGIADLTFGTVRRIGVMKTVGGPVQGGGPEIPGANVDFPTLVGDSLRFLMGVMGSWTKNGHTVRPLFTYEGTSLSTQVYEPIKGTKDPFKSGPALQDTGWVTTSQSAILGCSWTWDRGVGGNLELSSTKRNLDFDQGMSEWEDQSHTDMGMAMGVEVSHRIVPQWKEKVPASMDFSLRLGWERKSLSGLSIEQGHLAGLTTGYESPVDGYDWPVDGMDNSLNHGWKGQEDVVGLAPTLGGGSDLNLFSYGVGASFLDRALQVDAALQSGTWTPNGGSDLDVFGWRAELRWSP